MISRVNKVLAIVLVVQQLCGAGIGAYGDVEDSNVDIGVNEVKKIVENIDKGDINNQIYEIYKAVGDEFGIPYTYVKALHKIAGGSTIYSDKAPNISTDKTIDGMKAPFEIDGVMQIYDKVAEFIECDDKSIERPSKYYLPDAAYNVTSSVVSIMEKRKDIDRGSYQRSFNRLIPEVKQNLIFYESVMEYLGYSEAQINAMHNIYEEILRSKDRNEYVIKLNDDGSYNIKDKFKDILMQYGIENIEPIAIMISFDSILAANDNVGNIKIEVDSGEILPLHFEIGKTSRANMMLAAIPLVGKVRYVWGGGHGQSSKIQGINPIWLAFNDLYNVENSSGCLQSGNTDCRIHRDEEGNSSLDICSSIDGTVRTIGDYIALREGCMDGLYNFETLRPEERTTILKDGSSASAHSIEGLDCSGFVSWVFNQIDTTRQHESVARNFVQYNNLDIIDYGEELLPGDIVAWNTHIIMIVGATDDEKRTYIEIEATPSTVRFGVAYYEDATQESIDYAKKLAREANSLIGNVSENPGIKKLDSYKEKGLIIGRYNNFKDDEYIIPEYGTAITELKAKEIIKYSLSFIPKEYVYGRQRYKGEEFSYAG